MQPRAHHDPRHSSNSSGRRKRLLLIGLSGAAATIALLSYLNDTVLPPRPPLALASTPAPAPDAGVAQRAPAAQTPELVQESSLPGLPSPIVPPPGSRSILSDARTALAPTPSREIIASNWAGENRPELAKFNDWADRYVAAPPAERASMAEEGATLAATRRAYLGTLIPSDPRRALSAAVPLGIRSQLPARVEAQLEQRVSGFGDLYRLHTTPVEGGEGAPTFTYAQVNGKSYRAYRYGSRDEVPSLKGASVHGIEVDGQLAVSDSPVRKIEPGENVAGQALNEDCPVSGVAVKSIATDTTAAEKSLFQVGTDLYGTCEPAHVEQVDATLASLENSGGSTQKKLTNHDLQAAYKAQIRALSDSGVSGESGYIGKPPTSLTHGGKNILIMRVQPTDKPFPSWATETTFSNTVWQSDGWNTRTKRTSYDKAWINRADVTPVMNLPQASSYYVVNGTDYQWGRWLDDSKAQAAARGYNLNDYACFVVAHEGYGNLGAAGWGGGGSIWCNGNFDIRLFVHEYGHVFWLPHANAWYATDGNPFSPSRQHKEYGDANDPMGNAWGANQYNTYNAFYKNFCGWLPDSAVQTISRSGTYRVYQDDGTTSLTRTLALKLGRDYEFNYWISIRGDAISQPNFNNGVAIMAVSGFKTSDSHLLDLNNPGDDNRDNAPLALNQQWTDTAADITFKTVAVGGTNPNRYADVQITFGPRYTGGYRPLVAGGIYRFKNRHNGKYLDVPGNSNTNSTAIQVATASGTDSQNWVAQRNSDGTYSFNHRGTDKWLDVQSNSGSDGADILQYTGNGSDAQRFFVNQIADGHLYLVHKNTEKVLDMDPSGVNDLHQWGINYGAWQQWYPELVGINPGTYRVMPRHAQRQTLDISGGGTADGTQAQIWEWVAVNNQKWQVSDVGSGRIRLSPAHATGSALDIDNSGTANGTKTQLWLWNGSAAQRWSFSRVDGNWFRLTPDCAPGSCLDVAGGTGAVGNGTVTHLWQWLDGQNQHWRFADSDL